MHPTFTHVPPSVLSFSTQTVERPSWAARMDATYPPGPAPRTRTSGVAGGIDSIADCGLRIAYGEVERCKLMPDRNSGASCTRRLAANRTDGGVLRWHPTLLPIRCGAWPSIDCRYSC